MNIIAKATSYQRKKNLKVPTTYRCNSFVILNNVSLADHADKVEITIGNDDLSKYAIVSDLVEEEKERCDDSKMCDIFIFSLNFVPTR